MSIVFSVIFLYETMSCKVDECGDDDLDQGDIGHQFLVNKAAKSGVMWRSLSLLTGVGRSRHELSMA